MSSRRFSKVSIKPNETDVARMEEAIAGFLGAARLRVAARLRAVATAMHHHFENEGLVAAAPPPGPGNVGEPESLFSPEEWAAMTVDDLEPLIGEIMVDAATRASYGYAFDVSDPRIVAAVADHVATISAWGDDMQAQVSDLVTAGMAAGDSVDEMAAAMADGGVLSDAAAMRIARTESLSAANTGTLEGWRATGLVSAKTWQTAPGACEECAPLEGETVGIDENFSTDDDCPPAHPNCRCDMLSVEATDDGTGDEGQMSDSSDAQLDGEGDAGTVASGGIASQAPGTSDTGSGTQAPKASGKELSMTTSTATFTTVRAHDAATSSRPWKVKDQQARVRPTEAPAYYRALYAQRDGTKPADVATSWRFLHHEVSAKGDPGPANVHACVRLIALLNGMGHGLAGVDRKEFRSLYNHAAGHIRSAGGTPPAFVELAGPAVAPPNPGDKPAPTKAAPVDKTGDGTPFQPAPYAPDGDETVTCPACGKMNDTDASFCDQCGGPLTPTEAYAAEGDETVQCPACQKMNDLDASFCDQCGEKLAGNSDVKVVDDAPPPGPLTALAEGDPAAPATPADPGDQPAEPATADVADAAMVALFPDDPSPFVTDGGDPAEQIHLTVVYLGKVADLDDATLASVRAQVSDFAAGYTSDTGGAPGTITATAFATSTFGGGDDGDTDAASVVLMQGADLDSLEDDLVDPLRENAEDGVPNDYPVWFPHITIGYGIDTNDALIGTTATFSSISLVVAGQREDFPLGVDTDTGTADGEGDSDSGAGDGSGGVKGNGDGAPGLANRHASGLAAETELPDSGFQVNDKGEWSGILVIEGSPSGDGRQIEAGALSWRELPLPLMVMFGNPEGGEGHAGAELAGRIDKIWRTDPNQVWGCGVFDLKSQWGLEAKRLVGDGFLRGVSADLDAVQIEYENEEPDTLEGLFDWDPGLMIVTAGRVMGATLCPFPAFQEASIKLLKPGNDGDTEMEGEEPMFALAASAGGPDVQVQVYTPLAREGRTYALVASAGGFPVAPSAAWFAKPVLDGPTPVRITPEGRVYGHPAAWESSHIGFIGRRVPPPHSRNGYANFRTGQVLTAEGTMVNTGPLVMDTVHPNLRMRASDAQCFYADTGCAIGDVAVYEDQYGIVIAGAIRPTASLEQIRAARGSDWSPDWRPINGHQEMVALLAVNNTGFKVEALAASAGTSRERMVLPGRQRVLMECGTGKVTALVAAGMVHHRGSGSEVALLRAELAELAAIVRPLRAERARAIAAGIRSNTHA